MSRKWTRGRELDNWRTVHQISTLDTRREQASISEMVWVHFIFLIFCLQKSEADFSSLGSLGGGFNAGIPGRGEGALGGGWTLTKNNLTFGFGGVYNNVSIKVAVFGDKTTGEVTVQVNGKDVHL